jgi:signal transduction histidine kinase
MISGQGSILVVDDNVVNRKLLERALIEQGHKVEKAENGRQALQLLRASLSSRSLPASIGALQSPSLKEDAEAGAIREFDVVLLDILMPEMDGYETLAEIKGDPDLRHIPVIMISGLDEIDSVVRCIEMGAEDYLSKPFNPLLLKARLGASLEKKKLRDLERAYLQQEVALRQREKLATLGRLSAGMAHELNNPAAAARRGVEQLKQTISQLQQACTSLILAGLDPGHMQELNSLYLQAQSNAGQPTRMNPLARSELEAEIEKWLEGHQVSHPWEYTPALSCVFHTRAELSKLDSQFTAGQLPAVIAWLSAMIAIHNLITELGQGAGRISQIVNALKSYTYMDQAPIQNINIHDGLRDTLEMLSNKIKRGIQVRQEYSQGQLRIQAYGSELNQVWTHLIENAIDALQGHGEIIIRTREEERWAVIEIEDNGPGIPAAIQSKIFDPFFTTKPPGEGAGLGLSVSHNIVVQKHAGKIGVRSHPGQTVFDVWLPMEFEAQAYGETVDPLGRIGE